MPVKATGKNGDFTIRFLPETTVPNSDIADTCLIGYIPRSSQQCTVASLLGRPADLLPTDEAVDISCRVCLHTFGVMAGTRPALVKRVRQDSALAALREEFPNARQDVLDMKKG